MKIDNLCRKWWCEHVKTLDLNAREHIVVEKMPKDILTKIIDIVFSEIEQIED